MPKKTTPNQLLTSFGRGSSTPFLRDQLDINTWLLIGAILQCAISLLPLSNSIKLTPALCALTYKVIDTVMISYNLKANPMMDKVITHKQTNSFEKDDSFDGFVVFIIGAQINQFVTSISSCCSRISSSPRGFAAPGGKEIGGYFFSMIEDLEKNAVQWGLMAS